MLRFLLCLLIVPLNHDTQARILTDEPASVGQAIRAFNPDWQDSQALETAEKCFISLNESSLKDAHVVWRFLGALMMTGQSALQNLHDSIVKSGYDGGNDSLAILGYCWSADVTMNNAEKRILTSRFHMEKAKIDQTLAPSFTTPNVWQAWLATHPHSIQTHFPNSASNPNSIYWYALFQQATLPDLWKSIFGEPKVEPVKLVTQAPIPVIPPKKVHDTGSPQDIQTTTNRVTTITAVISIVREICSSIKNIDDTTLRQKWEAYNSATEAFNSLPPEHTSVLNPPLQRALAKRTESLLLLKEDLLQKAQTYLDHQKDCVDLLLNCDQAHTHKLLAQLAQVYTLLQELQSEVVDIVDVSFIITWMSVTTTWRNTLLTMQQTLTQTDKPFIARFQTYTQALNDLSQISAEDRAVLSEIFQSALQNQKNYFTSLKGIVVEEAQAYAENKGKEAIDSLTHHEEMHYDNVIAKITTATTLLETTVGETDGVANTQDITTNITALETLRNAREQARKAACKVISEAEASIKDLSQKSLTEKLATLYSAILEWQSIDRKNLSNTEVTSLDVKLRNTQQSIITEVEGFTKAKRNEITTANTKLILIVNKKSKDEARGLISQASAAVDALEESLKKIKQNINVAGLKVLIDSAKEQEANLERIDALTKEKKKGWTCTML